MAPTLSLTEISIQLPSTLADLHQSLKASHRKQRATEFRDFLNQRETQGQLGRLKMAVRTILPTKRKRHDLATLEVDGTTIVDPVDIALRLKEFKTQWFQPQDPSVINWAEVLHSEAAFRAHACQRGVPSHLTDIIWSSLNKPMTPSQDLTQFQQDVMRTPTYDEWLIEVQHTSAGSAGGMSGLTYDILKLLPTSTLQEMYQALAELWNTPTDDPSGRTIPESWRWRWLVPIPKADNPTLDQLLEVLRCAYWKCSASPGLQYSYSES